jgi:hypothetical protein
MDESDASAHNGEGRRPPDTLLSRIRLWTRTSSSYLQEPVTVDEAPTTRRIVDLSSIAARYVSPFYYVMFYHSSASRTRSPPTSLPSTTRNAAQETNRVNLTNGQSTRTSARFPDRFERNRALFTKYGLDITESEWTIPTNRPVQRVERSIRMRIRFWCYHCNTQYGSSRVCSQCTHQRCNRCVRHPPRRTAPRVRLADAARISNALSTENLHAHSTAEPASNSQYIAIPVIPNAYPRGGRESVPRTEALLVSQQEFFPGGTCPEHLDPNRSRISRRHRVRVRYTCHECHRTFLRGESTCSACGHEQCKDCPRDPPRRRYPGTGSSNRTLEHSTLSFDSESDDGGDEYENETISPKAPMGTMREVSAADTVASPLRPSTILESINARDMAVAPPEPPPPV